MKYVIEKVNHGWVVKELPIAGYYAGIWAYSTLPEALECINMLFKPPILMPEGTVVLA